GARRSLAALLALRAGLGRWHSWPDRAARRDLVARAERGVGCERRPPARGNPARRGPGRAGGHRPNRRRTRRISPGAADRIIAAPGRPPRGRAGKRAQGEAFAPLGGAGCAHGRTRLRPEKTAVYRRFTAFGLGGATLSQYSCSHLPRAVAFGLPIR